MAERLKQYEAVTFRVANRKVTVEVDVTGLSPDQRTALFDGIVAAARAEVATRTQS